MFPKEFMQNCQVFCQWWRAKCLLSCLKLILLEASQILNVRDTVGVKTNMMDRTVSIFSELDGEPGWKYLHGSFAPILCISTVTPCFALM